MFSLFRHRSADDMVMSATVIRKRHGRVRHCFTRTTCWCPPLFYANDMLVSATVLRERHRTRRYGFEKIELEFISRKGGWDILAKCRYAIVHYRNHEWHMRHQIHIVGGKTGLCHFLWAWWLTLDFGFRFVARIRHCHCRFQFTNFVQNRYHVQFQVACCNLGVRISEV